jgi:hypothetical protein
LFLVGLRLWIDGLFSEGRRLSRNKSGDPRRTPKEKQRLALTDSPEEPPMSAAALMLLLPLVLAWAEDDPEPPSSFAALGRARIKALVDRNEKNHRATINGTVGNGNELTDGTIVLYVTNEKNYGKFQVVKHGQDMAIRFVTYDAKGAVLTKKDKHVVRSSWQLDLDYGIDGGDGKSRPDFWWRYHRKVQDLVSENGAAFLIHKTGKK